MAISIKSKGAAAVPFMAGFQPLKTLWDGVNAPYPSEWSARWFIRKERARLVQEQAIALHRNRTMVHVERFAAAAQRSAVEAFSKRTAESAE